MQRYNNMNMKKQKQRGFSLVEVLLLVLVLGIVGTAAGQALQSIARIPGQADLHFQIETRLISRMEEIRAMDFDAVALGNPSSLSDSIPIGPHNTTYTRNVVVALADANGDGNVEATFKQVTITCGGQSVTMLLSKGTTTNPSPSP